MTITRAAAAISLTAVLAAALTLGTTAFAAAPPKPKAKPKPAAPPRVAAAPARTTPVGLPQDAGPHDKVAAIEWWYYNAFLTSESGKRYAVIASFFRTGLPGARKGHYLLYSLADLDAGTARTYSVLDRANVELLKSYLPLVALQRPDDANLYRLLDQLQRNALPAPHRTMENVGLIRTRPTFSIVMDENTFTQTTPDARTWQAALSGGANSGGGDEEWTLDLTLTQPADRPAMLVGGNGKTGIRRPDDMFYVSLTRMDAKAELTRGGIIEKLTGTGWVDRQWGTSWVVEDNGWDWWGVRLSDGSDLIVYRLRDNKTGRILKAHATRLTKDGTQILESAPVFKIGEMVAADADDETRAAAARDARWTDPKTGIIYPVVWTVTLPNSGLSLTIKPYFRSQTIPVVGIGDAIWEGAVAVTGTGKEGAEITGDGYMELVGYRKPRPAPKKSAAAAR